MGSTEVMVNVGSLQTELERAKTNLKGLNENIRRIIGREPNDTTVQLRGDRKRLFGVPGAAGGGGGGGQSYSHHHSGDGDRRRGQLTGADFAAVDRNKRRRHQDASPPPLAQPTPSKRRYQQQHSQPHQPGNSHSNSNTSETTGSATKSVFSRLSGPPSAGRASFHNQHHSQHSNHHHGQRDQQQQQQQHHRKYHGQDDAAAAGDADETVAADDNDDDDNNNTNNGNASDDDFDPDVAHVAPPRPKPRLHSRVIRELPTRQEIVAAQGTDPAARARNRRMFGSLLGTLQKFCQEESRLKPKEDRKAQIEQKLEAQQLQERETMRRERQDLFANRKRQQLEIKQLESKMARMRELAAWEAAKQPLGNFIRTKAKPRLYYLPKVMDARTTERLAESRAELEKTIAKKRAEVTEELASIEGRFKQTDGAKHGDEVAAAVDNGAAASAAIKSEFGKHDRRSPLEDNEEEEEEEENDDDDNDGPNADESEEATLVDDAAAVELEEGEEEEEEAGHEMNNDSETDGPNSLLTQNRSVLLVKRERIDDKPLAVRVLVENDLMESDAMDHASDDENVSRLKEEEEEEEDEEEGRQHSVSE